MVTFLVKSTFFYSSSYGINEVLKKIVLISLINSAPAGPYSNHPETFNGVPIGALRVEEMAARVAWLRTQPPDVQARQRQVLRQWEIYEEMLQQRQQQQGQGNVNRHSTNKHINKCYILKIPSHRSSTSSSSSNSHKVHNSSNNSRNSRNSSSNNNNNGPSLERSFENI
ncbi:hypothetical protein RUND412_008490 [Rhizina undulata]